MLAGTGFRIAVAPVERAWSSFLVDFKVIVGCAEPPLQVFLGAARRVAGPSHRVPGALDGLAVRLLAARDSTRDVNLCYILCNNKIPSS